MHNAWLENLQFDQKIERTIREIRPTTWVAKQREKKMVEPVVHTLGDFGRQTTNEK